MYKIKNKDTLIHLIKNAKRSKYVNFKKDGTWTITKIKIKYKNIVYVSQINYFQNCNINDKLVDIETVLNYYLILC